SAVKAALHRGRARLQVLSETDLPGKDGLPADVSPAIRRYAALFNAHDWDAVRDMLIEDVRLEEVDATRRRGRKEVGVYFSNYSGRTDWYMVPARLEGREGLAVLVARDSALPRNFIALVAEGERIAAIRDFHHVPYLTTDARIDLLGTA